MISMYDVSVPVFIRAFENLSRQIDKAAASGIAEKDLVEARLAPDMYPLSGQVQRASDTAKASLARLTGLDVPSFPDDETTLDALKARIAKTVDLLRGASPAAFEGAETRTVEMKPGGRAISFDGRSYLLTFALPNFFFHVTTAYAILRHQGVAIGKLDYLGPLAA